MFEIQVSKKLKEKKLIALLEFLHSISTEICFSCFHKHHISEETSVEILNEYKDRCKERHHQLTSWYQQEEPFLMNVLKKLHIKTEEQFNEYKMEIFQNEMIVCKKMDEMLLKLQEETTTIDYKEVFESIKDDFKEVETHMFDSVTVSIFPLDYVVYNTSENLLSEIIKVKSLFLPFFSNEKENLYLFNPVFCKNQEGFGVISTESGIVTMVLDIDDYKKFKTLKIRHKKEVIPDENQ